MSEVVLSQQFLAPKLIEVYHSASKLARSAFFVSKEVSAVATQPPAILPVREALNLCTGPKSAAFPFQFAEDPKALQRFNTPILQDLKLPWALRLLT